MEISTEEVRVRLEPQEYSERPAEEVGMIANGSSSVYSGSVSQEVDVVDLYKKKIQSNIRLKQKNLRVIRGLFAISLVVHLLLAVAFAFGFVRLPAFVFRATYLNGLATLTGVASRLFAVAYTVRTNHLFINQTDPQDGYNITASVNLTNSRPNSTTNLNETLQKYVGDASSKLDNLLRLDPQSFLGQDNAVRTAAYAWGNWTFGSSVGTSTLLGFFKALGVSLDYDTLYNPEYFSTSPLCTNAEALIQKLVDLEEAVRVEFDGSKDSMSTLLFYALLFEFAQ